MRRSLSALVVLVTIVGAVVVATLGAVVVGAVPCGAVTAQPRCQVALLPGPSEDILGLVTIDGATTFPSSGELLLTTIAVRDDLDLQAWWEARRTPGVATVARETVFPVGSDTDEVAEQNALLMADSQMTAAIAALDAAGFDVDDVAGGARVAEIQPDAATDELRIDDVITAVDGTDVREAATLVERIADRAPGDTVTLEVASADGAPRGIDVTLGAAPDDDARPYIGVLLTTELELPVDVAIDAGAIGGPSAGMMFALGVVELLGEEDLTGGEVVAGTGTITADGSVGPVGGVRQKLVAVTTRDGGADPASIFLVPRVNLPDAHRAPVSSDLTVVPVDDLDEVLAALEDVRAGRRPQGAVELVTD